MLINMYPNPLRLFLPPLLIAFATLTVPAQADSSRTDNIAYVIKRGGDAIGTLKIGFERNGKRLTATSNYTIRVKLLSIVLYRYEKHMVETYEDGRLVAFKTAIDDDGEKSQVSIIRTDDNLIITNQKGNLSAPLGTFPSTYWPPETPSLTQLIDSSDGTFLSVKTSGASTESLAIDGSIIKSKRYEMSGDLKRTLWYSAETGEWLKLKMTASDNSTIEIERDWPPIRKEDIH
jgi:outer membrane lipoprotein-sorting protein